MSGKQEVELLQLNFRKHDIDTRLLDLPTPPLAVVKVVVHEKFEPLFFLLGEALTIARGR